jgi:hypothetical protein
MRYNHLIHCEFLKAGRMKKKQVSRTTRTINIKHHTNAASFPNPSIRPFTLIAPAPFLTLDSQHTP